MIESSKSKRRNKDRLHECVTQNTIGGVPPIEHEWQDAVDSVTVRLSFGPEQSPDVTCCEATKQSFSIQLQDGRSWSCEFFEEVDRSSFAFKTKGPIMEVSVKKAVAAEWPHVFKTTCRLLEMEISNIKKNLYEKGNDYLTVCFYVKNVKPDAVVEFKERELSMQFKTSDPKFLSMHDYCDEETLFVYRTALRDVIVPELSQFSLTASTINVTIRKKVSKKWDTFEEPRTEGVSHSPMASNTWVPVVKSPPSPSASVSTSRSPAPTVPVHESASVPVGSASAESKKKPTCMVPPLNKSEAEAPVGLTGLDNLGNSCFMNSVIQTLVNTRELRDFFLESYFQRDINVDNPLGFKGQLAITYALLCRTLWSGRHRSCEPSKLKALVSTKASQFTGFAQHDAQEFMAFLLDGLHEDLNRVVDRPYVETKDWEGEPDEVFAEHCWNRFKLRDDSAIIDLFQGQYKSKLVCPVCQHVSIKFDPFFYLSVPLPKKFRYLPIYFFSKDPSKKPVKYMMKILPETNIENLKEQISLRTKVHVSNLRIFEVYKSKIHRFFGKIVNLSVVSPKDLIFVFEVLSAQLAGEPVVEVSIVQRIVMPNRSSKCSFCDRYYPQGVQPQLKRCTKCYRASYCDQSCQKNHWGAHKANCKYNPELVGLPFILSLPRSQATYSKICQMMESYARYSVDLFHPPVQNADIFLPSSGSASSASSSASSLSSFNEAPNSGDSVSSSELTHSEPASRNQSILGDDESAYGSMSQSCECDPPGLSSVSGKDVARSEACDWDEGVRPPVRIVFGQSRNEGKPDRTDPMFYVQPVNQHGISLLGANGKRLEDRGDTPLELTLSSYYSMDWQNNEKTKNYVLVQSKQLEIDESLSDMDGYEEQSHFTLDQCLQLFTEPETLAPEEAWYCPKCKHHREATKQMSVWRLPTVLIVQLKRFSFKGYLYKDKIDKMVEYPVRGLDLSPYYCGPQMESSNEPPPVYDLYAVINHYGNILGGHYTAVTRLMDKGGANKTEIDWRLFDDSHVTWASETMAMARSAYVLFYRRRGVACDLSERLIQQLQASTPGGQA